MLLLNLFLACSSPQYDNQDTSVESSLVESCATLYDRVICDFDAINSSGDLTQLSQLYGQPIVLDLSAGWCGPCKLAALNLQDTADLLPGVTFLTVLIENEVGQPPNGSDLQDWMSDYSIITEPVWGSSREIISSNPIDMENHLFLAGWPSFYFIDSDGRLQGYMRGYDEASIVQAAEALN